MIGCAKFITFEGVEGAGKSTQIALCSQFLSQEGIPHIQTRQPGDTIIGKKLRAVLLDPQNTNMDPTCEAHLYMADRAQHLFEQIKPALNKGLWVLCDRYHDSTLAYQGFARGIKGLSYEGFLKPDLTFLINLNPETGLNRARSRNTEQNLIAEARFENEQLKFHKKVQEGFLSLARQEPHRFAVIDANGPAETIFARIKPWFQKLMENDCV